MFVFDCVFVIIVCMLCCDCQLVRGSVDSEEEIDEETLPEDHYSFVALIDIVFTNDAEKTCTGTIIHDNVVITAAHCFTCRDENIKPEITASFVVIGTKKMFETGYEQYLPIERITIHPKYEGWTADLALVRTFAGMMSDKPGQVIPLATESTNTAVDSDVLVFSWGKLCNSDDVKLTKMPVKETSTSEKPFELETEPYEDGPKTDELEEEYATNEEFDEEVSKEHHVGRKRKKRKRFRMKNARNRKPVNYIPVTRSRGHSTWVPLINKLNKPMSSFEENIRYNYKQQLYDNLTDFNSEVEQKSWESKLEKLNQMYLRSEVNNERLSRRERRQSDRAPIMSVNRIGWRRNMGSQQNKLTIEIFGFINMYTCQKLVQKSVPPPYRIKKRQEVLCYASERRYITEDDAGAPAMRRGRLVAVTVGSADFEGEYVAIGLKMVCFCSWIAENLPKGGTRPHCCKSCCDTNSEEKETKMRSHRHLHKKRKPLL